MSTQRGEIVSSAAASPRGSRALRAILAGGLIGGACDIAFAGIVFWLRGMSPIRLGQAVASGLLGREAAFAGGVATGVLGLCLHFAMALMMAAFYFLMATRIPLLVKRPVACGLAYGLGLYLVMNFVVVPLSAIGSRGALGPLYIVIPEILVHMCLVGLPMALFTHVALRRD